MGISPSLPTKYVLVPPCFERDLRARSRLAKNSYDYAGTRRAMKWLLHDLLDLNGPGAVHTGQRPLPHLGPSQPPFCRGVS